MPLEVVSTGRRLSDATIETRILRRISGRAGHSSVPKGPKGPEAPRGRDRQHRARQADRDWRGRRGIRHLRRGQGPDRRSVGLPIGSGAWKTSPLWSRPPLRSRGRGRYSGEVQTERLPAPRPTSQAGVRAVDRGGATENGGAAASSGRRWRRDRHGDAGALIRERWGCGVYRPMIARGHRGALTIWQSLRPILSMVHVSWNSARHSVVGERPDSHHSLRHGDNLSEKCENLVKEDRVP